MSDFFIVNFVVFSGLFVFILSITNYLFKGLIIYLKRRMRERKIPPAVHYPDACNALEWSRPKSRERNSFWASHVAFMDPRTWPSSSAYHGVH